MYICRESSNIYFKTLTINNGHLVEVASVKLIQFYLSNHHEGIQHPIIRVYNEIVLSECLLCSSICSAKNYFQWWYPFLVEWERKQMKFSNLYVINIHANQECLMRYKKVTVWYRFWSVNSGPFFIQNDIGYVTTLCWLLFTNFFWSKFDDLDTNVIWFQQNDTTCYTSRVIEVMKTAFVIVLCDHVKLFLVGFF